MMPPLGTSLALGLATIFAVAGGEIAKEKSKDNVSTASATSNEMGPAALYWPPDRPWSAAMDNQPPCGSLAGPDYRTNFPITNGYLALVIQDDTYHAVISISYLENPTSSHNFTKFVEAPVSLNPGHQCVRLPDPPSNIAPGTKATLQMKYEANWDAPHNQTFYACADITYVPRDKAREPTMPCFQAEEPGEDDEDYRLRPSEKHPSGLSPGNASVASDALSSDAPSAAAANSTVAANSGLRSGAIAGIVVGCLAGVSLCGAGVLFLLRHRAGKRRALRLARMEENARQNGFPMDKYSTASNRA